MAEEKEIIKKKKVKIDNNGTFGHSLKQYMVRDRWSGAKLAKEVGVTRNHISSLLSGTTPSYMLALKICAVFNCTIKWCPLPAIPKNPRKKKGGVAEVASEEPVVESKEEAAGE